MQNETLNHNIEKFDLKRQLDIGHFQHMQNLQQAFVNDLSINVIKRLDIIFEAHTLTPKIWQIKEPLKIHQDKFTLTPINYQVKITVN